MRLCLDRFTVLGIAAIAAVASAGAAGCATPAPIYRLTPRSNEVYWVAGRPSVQKEAAGVRAAVAFEHQDGETLRVRVEMMNQSDARFDVKPTDFSFVTCTNESVASCGGAKPIVDPEMVLGALDERESRERADSVNDQAVLVPLLLLSAAAEVAAASKGHGGSVGVLRTAAIADRMDSNEARHDSATRSIGDQREMWSNGAFRRNTLAPGGGTAGFITIPIESNVKYVWLTVRAAGQSLPFCFEQSVKQVLLEPSPTSSGSSQQGY
jgi:hypothetical protein